MPLLLENAHATALLNRIMNLVKEAMEHLNPNQGESSWMVLDGQAQSQMLELHHLVLQNLLWKHLNLPGQAISRRLQMQLCIFCSRVSSFLMCSLSLIMLSAPNNGKHRRRWWCRASCPRMSVDVLETRCDQCRSMLQCCFTSTEAVRLIRTESPGRPPQLSHSSWTMRRRLNNRSLNTGL